MWRPGRLAQNAATAQITNETFNDMKTRLDQSAGRRAFGASVLATALVPLLAVLPATGQTDTPFTATSWLTGVPVPGFLGTNALGQVSLKGNVHVLRVQADDARVAGRLQAMPDVAFQADGTRVFSGTAYDEVGTWDATGANFTPAGGLWCLKYQGVTQADGSVQYTMAGYGIGGTIDGLRVELTATRPAGPTFDPTIPYLASGTIKPAPVDTRVVLDDFDDNQIDPAIWTTFGAVAGTVSAVEVNQQFTIQGTWQTPTHGITDYTAWGWAVRPWAVLSGQTIEVRVDVVGLSQTATASELAIYHAGGQAYVFTAARDWIAIAKQYLPGNACFLVDKVTTKTTDVVLVLALTPVGQNVVVTAKVLDKADGAVLHQSSVVDTPASDPALTRDEVAQLTGGILLDDLRSDPSGAPWTSGVAFLLGVFQNTDGTLSAAEATFDNFELRTYEVPPVGIERTVQLTWPAPAGMNYAVEGAPTVQGPWLPIDDVATPGLKQMTVPANDIMKFFRLQQAP